MLFDKVIQLAVLHVHHHSEKSVKGSDFAKNASIASHHRLGNKVRNMETLWKFPADLKPLQVRSFVVIVQNSLKDWEAVDGLNS